MELSSKEWGTQEVCTVTKYYGAWQYGVSPFYSDQPTNFYQNVTHRTVLRCTVLCPTMAWFASVSYFFMAFSRQCVIAIMRASPPHSTLIEADVRTYMSYIALIW